MISPLYDALDALYATLPKLACQRRCQQACGPVLMSPVEHQRMLERVGRVPRLLTKGLVCSMLTPTGACSAYQFRPLICRLWGLVPDMACPWGCKPERWVTKAEAHALLDEIAMLTGTATARSGAPVA